MTQTNTEYDFDLAGDLSEDHHALAYEAKYRVSDEVRRYWKARGYNVGIGGERLINGFPESLTTVTPHKFRADKPGFIHLDRATPDGHDAVVLARTNRRLLAQVKELSREIDALKEEIAIISSFGDGEENGGVLGGGAPASAVVAIREIAKIYNVDAADIVGKSRFRVIHNPRLVLIGWLREELNWSYPRIGSALEGRDHTSIMHAYKRYRQKVKEGHLTPFVMTGES